MRVSYTVIWSWMFRVSALWYCVCAASSVSPAALEEGHQLVSQLSQLCGSLHPDGWALRWGAVSAALTGSAVDLSKMWVSLVQVLTVGAPWLHSERGVFEHPAGRGDWGRSFHLQGGRAHGEKSWFTLKQPKQHSATSTVVVHSESCHCLHLSWNSLLLFIHWHPRAPQPGSESMPAHFCLYIIYRCVIQHHLLESSLVFQASFFFCNIFGRD